MATNTYIALDKVTVGTATPSITFTGISGAYTDLVVVASAKSSLTTTTQVQLTFNSDTTTNYSWTRLLGDGSAASSARASTQSYVEVGYIAGNTGSPSPDLFTLNIQNYSNTTTFKTFLSRWGSMNAANQYVAAVVGLWRKTPEAITSLTLTANSANFAVGSTFSLYGIAASSVAAKATGGAIYADSTYYYHVFAASGTFTPTQSITADVLVVAGGGGAANGGGGAGGLLYFASQSLTATGYTCTVGAGGAGGNSTPTRGTNGGDSQFGALTLVKGGGASGAGALTAGQTGGSGGGGSVPNGAGGSATSGQGFAGGTAGTASGFYAAAGGGGAGAVGNNGNSAVGGGAGGVGLSTYSAWGLATGFGQNVSGTYYYAGGGGGGADSGTSGAGGFGGGGSGTSTSTGVAGLANTGGGGGGASNLSGTGAAGGSGIIIVRYAK